MAEKKVYGASRETWRTYVDNGWGSMMLPVVSDPNAKIDAASKLGTLGKTPSVLTPSGTVVGLLKWTQMPITPQQIAVWEGRGYGISLRCGTIVAFDCDVDSPELANALLDEFSLTFGDGFPVRRRKNSARWLAVFKITEPISKGRVVFPGGDMVEVLCAGQQFIAEGTHPSGSRYTWSEPLVLSRLPVVTPESVFDFMDGVAKRYNAELQRGKQSARPEGETIEMEDPLAEWLRASGYVIDENAGVLNIRCPWEDSHTSKSAASATSYFVAGLNGRSTPGFKCMHAHCVHRTYDDLLQWAYSKGYKAPVSGLFPELPAIPDEDKAHDEMLSLIERSRDPKTGRVDATLPTVMAALRLQEYSRVCLAYDTFTGSIVYKDVAASGRPLRGDKGYYSEWKEFGDPESVLMRARLEHEFQFKPISKELMRDAVSGIALGGLTVVDTMQEFIGKKLPVWDGVPRVEKFYSEICGAEDSEYSKELGRYTFAALFGRAYVTTGVKADITPILIGEQGTYKSTLVAALALRPGTSREVPFLSKDDDMKRQLRGASVVEIPELSGMKKRDVDEVKFFLSLIEDSWIPKYMETMITMPRRCVFFATTNNVEVLVDPTGSRRFAPIETGAIQIDQAREIMPQLWAEGREIFVKEGIPHKRLEALAKLRAHKFEAVDPWEDAALEWIAKEEARPSGERTPFTSANILTCAIGLPAARISRREMYRLGALMRSAGYASIVAKVEGRSVRVWSKG